MKKNKAIFLSLAFTAAIASCGREDEDWVDGRENGRYRDTVANGRQYRHYGGMWYPIMGGRIAPSLYQGLRTRILPARASRRCAALHEAARFAAAALAPHHIIPLGHNGADIYQPKGQSCGKAVRAGYALS